MSSSSHDNATEAITRRQFSKEAAIASTATVIAPSLLHAQTEKDFFDIVIKSGRVMDPETGFDKIANVGVKNGRIAKRLTNN